MKKKVFNFILLSALLSLIALSGFTDNKSHTTADSSARTRLK